MIATTSRNSTRRVQAIVLLSGIATMALQMAVVRLFAPWFGNSSVVWATTISASLLAMGTGYLVGGRRADVQPITAPLARTLTGAALLIALVPLVAPEVLPHVPTGETGADLATVLGVAVSYLVLAFVPAVLLGCTPTFAIRIAMRTVDRGGSTAGSLYGLSTFGSIVGTLVTALVLVQAIGTRWTFVVIAVVVAAAAVIATRTKLVGAPVDSASTSGPADADDDPVRASTVSGPRIISVRLALLVLAIEGVATMSAEFGMARLVAPFFGTSTIVWANIIGVTLGCIALGSWLGGRIVDRRPTGTTLTGLLVAAAATIAALPFVAPPVMRLATGGIDNVAVGTVVGSFLATIALLVIPVTLLGTLGPVVVRLAMRDVASSGALAGRSFAASTGGALIGTCVSALWLLPAIGTRLTLVAAAALLIVLPLFAPVTRGDRRTTLAVAITGLAILGCAFIPTGTIKPLDGNRVLAEDETRYQFAQVVEDTSSPGEERRLLQLNEGWAVHSIWDRAGVLVGGIWDHFLVLPGLLPEGRAERAEMLVVGNAAGTAARAFETLHPGVELEGVEIDADVTKLGRKWFELPDSQRVHTADGRPFLRGASGRTWDVIHVDAYRQPYIPFYLATEEFFELGRSRLAAGGVMSINVGSTPSDPAIVDAIAATMRAAFPLVVRYRAEEYNELVVGVDDADVTLDELRARLVAAEGAAATETTRLYRDFALGIRAVDPDPDAVLTDDRAPVEWMTDRMILREAG